METPNGDTKPMTATEPASPGQAPSDVGAVPRLLLAMMCVLSNTVHIIMSTARTTTKATTCAATACYYRYYCYHYHSSTFTPL